MNFNNNNFINLKNEFFTRLLRGYYDKWKDKVERREIKGERLGIYYLFKKFVLEPTKYFTLANILSFIRILLAYPLYLLLDNSYYYGALCLYLAATITDFFDGRFADAFNQKTESGKIMDPAADKILHTAVLVYLYQVNLLPMWLVVAIVIHMIILVLLALVFKPMANALGIKRESGANNYGKWKFTFEAIGFGLLCITLAIPDLSLSEFIIYNLGLILIIISLALALASILEHLLPGIIGKFIKYKTLIK